MISEENLMLYKSRDEVITELIEHCFPDQRQTALMLITDQLGVVAEAFKAPASEDQVSKVISMIKDDIVQ